jgi:DNA mismatch repair protein MutS2
MKQTSADLLEFEELRELVGRYVGSPMGKAGLEKVSPHSDRARLEASFAELQEAVNYQRVATKPEPSSRGNAVRLRFGGLPDCRSAVQKIRIEGASLDGTEIFELAALLDRASDIRSNLLAAADHFPKLAALAGELGEFRALLADLTGKILPDGSLADHASVALNRLRRSIERRDADRGARQQLRHASGRTNPIETGTA